MHKLTLKTEIVSVFLINLREGWQVVVTLLVQVYDTILVDFTELPSIADAVAKGIEAFLVPAELLDLGCCLGLFVKEALQLNEFLLASFPDEIAERFEFLAELLQRDKVFLLHLYNFLDAQLVGEQEESFGHKRVLDVEEWCQRKIAPFNHSSLLGGGEVFAVVYPKTVLTV